MLEKEDLGKYAIIVLILTGLVGVLLVFSRGPTGYAVYTKTDLGNIERGANWNKIDNGGGGYSLEIYNTIINYNNGTEYVPISYGSCGSYCFRDWNGLIYRVSNDSKKAYINLYDINDNYISSFGFGITGDRGSGIEKFTTLNFTWTWTQEHITETDEYVFRAYNNNPNFNWTQEFHFYSNQSMKIKNTIKNGLGVSIQNAKFWYIQTVGQEDGIWFNGTRYIEDTYKTRGFDSLLPQIKFEDYYIFEYDDLFKNGFNITDFYLGDGNVIGINNIRILAIGITKGNSVFPNGVSVIVDPTITLQPDATTGKDTYIREDDVDKGHGTDTAMRVGQNWVDSAYRGLIEFNLSGIPEDATISSATVNLYLYQGTNNLDNINIHRIIRSWVEGTTGYSGARATWLTYNGTSNWATAGGEYDSNIEDSQAITDVVGWYSWDVTNLVKQWHDGIYYNYGFLFKGEDEISDINYLKRFYSSDYATDPLLRPKLIVNYTVDIIPPSFSNYVESPISNSAYVLGQTYKFNVTINESNINSVWIEFNNINYTSGVTNISNVYTFTKTDLAAGTYSYRWWANDTLGNLNNSGIRYYAVDKADNTLILLSSAGWDYNYGTSATFSCSAVSGTPKLYVDNIEVSNPATSVLAVGVHTVKCNISESQNYSYEMSQGALTVNKASSQTSLIFDKTSPQIYGTSITPNCSVMSGVGSANLTLNGNYITSGQALNLGAGSYNFNCSLAESQNYTSSENVSSYIINPASTITSVLINPSSPIVYGEASNFSCSNSVGFEAILYVNGVNKNNEKGLNVSRAAGSYVVNCSSTGNENYSASSEQVNYVVNKALGNISLRLNGQENNITIDYPQQYNISATTLYGSVVIYFNGTDITADNGLNVTPARSAGYYNITAVSSGDENHSSVTITRWLNVTLDTIPPEINIISPQEGGSYGYNISLPLEFSVSDEHLDSCWYNLNNGVNITLANCQNTTFDAGSDGSYTIYLYANDSLGNLAVKNSSFTIAVGSPTIILNSPIGIYLNSHDIIFRYTPSDLDLSSCELWGNFNGEFKLNQTDNSPDNGIENIFNLNLNDGTYLWNVKCNDSQGHSVFNGNKTFYIDTVSPSITLSEPTGTKTSRTGIPIQFSIIDASPTTCWYNVKYTTGQEVLGNTTINCSSTSFTVSTDGDYVLTLYVKDFANNLNSASSSFSVDTSTQPPIQPPSGGGGGGSIYNVSKIGKLSVSLIGNIIAHPGDNKKIPLTVKNIGKIFLNNCRLIAKGDISSWIYSNSVKGIAPGQNVDFVFDLNVPEETAPEINRGSLEVKCEEASDAQNISVSIPKEFGLIEIKDIKQEGDILKINYVFNSSKFVGDNIDVEIWLTDENETELKRIVDKSPINKEGLIERNVEMQLPGGLEGGVYFIYFAFSNNVSNFIKKPVVLSITGRSITGRAVLDSEKGKFWVYILFLLIIGIAIFFIWRRHGKTEKTNKQEHNTSHKLNLLLRKKK